MDTYYQQLIRVSFLMMVMKAVALELLDWSLGFQGAQGGRRRGKRRETTGITVLRKKLWMNEVVGRAMGRSKVGLPAQIALDSLLPVSTLKYHVEA